MTEPELIRQHAFLNRDTWEIVLSHVPFRDIMKNYMLVCKTFKFYAECFTAELRVCRSPTIGNGEDIKSSLRVLILNFIGLDPEFLTDSVSNAVQRCRRLQILDVWARKYFKNTFLKCDLPCLSIFRASSPLFLSDTSREKSKHLKFCEVGLAGFPRPTISKIVSGMSNLLILHLKDVQQYVLNGSMPFLPNLRWLIIDYTNPYYTLSDDIRVNRNLEVSLLRLKTLFRFEIDGLPSLHCIDLSILAMHSSLQEICVRCESTSSKYFHLALKVPQLMLLFTEVSDDFDDLTSHWRDEETLRCNNRGAEGLKELFLGGASSTDMEASLDLTEVFKAPDLRLLRLNSSMKVMPAQGQQRFEIVSKHAVISIRRPGGMTFEEASIFETSGLGIYFTDTTCNFPTVAGKNSREDPQCLSKVSLMEWPENILFPSDVVRVHDRYVGDTLDEQQARYWKYMRTNPLDASENVSA